MLITRTTNNERLSRTIIIWLRQRIVRCVCRLIRFSCRVCMVIIHSRCLSRCANHIIRLVIRSGISHCCMNRIIINLSSSMSIRPSSGSRIR